MAYKNSNRGALFRNNRKEADTDCDYRGSIDVDGVEFRLNAWIKTSKVGEKFMTLSLRPKEAAGDDGRRERTFANRREDIGF